MSLLTAVLDKAKARYQVRKFRKHHQITSKSLIFHDLYRDTNGFLLSKEARADHNDSALLYGEIAFEPFSALLSTIKPKCDDIFIDLGAGTGKACLCALLVFPIQKAIGIECLEPLYQAACNIQKKAPTDIKSKLYFEYDDFLNIDISMGTIIFINGTGFFGETWERIALFLSNSLDPGTRVILTSKILPATHFRLLRKTVCPMSWGAAHIQVYSKN